MLCRKNFPGKGFFDRNGEKTIEYLKLSGPVAQLARAHAWHA